MTSRSVAIVGGGIAGLSAAFDLHRAGWRVQVCEASDRWGGKIWSSMVGDRLVDAGPDTFLARVPHGKQLCDDLGLASELVAPVSPVPAYIHRAGTLHPLPTGTVLGVPTDLEALAASGVVSSEGARRAALDLTLPATRLEDPQGREVSVGAYCRARLGGEVTERLIDPLIGGINASHIDHLSLRSGAPQLWAAAQRSDSLIEGLRAVRAEVGATLGSASDEPVFLSLPDGGVARMVDRLVEELATADLRRSHPIRSIDELDADHVIVATPAPVAGHLVHDRAPTAAHLLKEIEYASVAQVTVELARRDVDPVLDASGILFPRGDGSMLTASTWFSTKWAHYARPDTVLVRLTSGRFGDDRPYRLDDDGLTRQLLDDLRRVIAISGEPLHRRVVRWPDAFPQYEPGHAVRVDAIDAALADELPNTHLIGAAYRGIGVPACIQDGRAIAARLIADHT